MAHPKKLYIGIDDTDNLETRGTGYRARQLIELLETEKLVEGLAVTRHQLLVDDRVPYTSHNSSACLAVLPKAGVEPSAVLDCCRRFLLEIAAPGSDVGLCMADAEQAAQVTAFGQRAKVELLYQSEARATAAAYGIALEGLTGDFQGIIGALSAVGLHVFGDDGRYLWPRELRALTDTRVSLETLLQCRGVDRVALRDGNAICGAEVFVQIGSWPRTVRMNQQAVLLVEKSNEQNGYKVLEKQAIKSIRP
ncbi:MAG: hypothetical protein R3E62_05300 [Pseudomonadales bacterium]